MDECLQITEEGLSSEIPDRHKAFLKQTFEQNLRIWKEFQATLLSYLQESKNAKSDSIQQLIGRVKEIGSFESFEKMLEAMQQQKVAVELANKKQTQKLLKAENNLQLSTEQHSALAACLSSLAKALKNSGPKTEVQNFLYACAEDRTKKYVKDIDATH